MDSFTGFGHLPETFVGSLDRRKVYFGNVLNFGINSLDDALSGIAKSDLIIYSAKSGCGKTEAATNTALHNAGQGKRVYYFALEAYDGEISDRIEFKIVSLYLHQINALQEDFFKKIGYQFNFINWMQGRFNYYLEDKKKIIGELFNKLTQNLYVKYRNREFTLAHLEKDLAAISPSSDLVIIDHLQYVDFAIGPHENENQACQKIVKGIRNIQLDTQVPIILVCHVRKDNYRGKVLVPSIDDIYSSSDIFKIATKIVMMAPVPGEPRSPTQYQTYMAIHKNRLNGSVTRYCTLNTFDISQNSYLKEYQIGFLNNSNNGQEFRPLGEESKKQWPDWYKKGQQKTMDKVKYATKQNLELDFQD